MKVKSRQIKLAFFISIQLIATCYAFDKGFFVFKILDPGANEIVDKKLDKNQNELVQDEVAQDKVKDQNIAEEMVKEENQESKKEISGARESKNSKKEEPKTESTSDQKKVPDELKKNKEMPRIGKIQAGIAFFDSPVHRVSTRI